ncbi:MAG TPA: DsbA family protein [Gemmatimonadaceae bacterium]|nr:DsbA family protein [Gemmatimonadaceae bacterium]
MTAAKKRGKGPFYAALAVIGVVGLAILLYLTNQRGESRVATLDPNLPPVKAVGYTLGSPNAPVEIIEFADFECPGCGQFALVTAPQVKKELVETGQARLRFLDFPVNSSHVNSITASLAAGCAHDQGKFWEMHDAIFRTQGEWSTQYTDNPRKIMNRLAEELNLDMAAFGQCVDSKKYQANIKANADEFQRVGAGSTPSFLIGGKILAGATFDEIKRAVDEARAAAPAGAGATTGATTGATRATTTP